MMRWQSLLTWWSCRKHPAADGTEGAMFQRALPVAPREPIESDVLEDGNLIQNCNETSDTAFAASDSTFDPTSVPPIESIAADTDIRAFLAPGVPAELARDALRRAWAADPKIRDFVGLADYDWDFNAPSSLPGFGSLEMTDELRQIAARIVGPLSAPLVLREGVAPSAFAAGRADDELRQNIAPEQEPHQREQNNRARYEQGHRAPEQPSHAAKKSQIIVKRRQGGALPK
jgi:Protein of unknown function (DUF3306)